MNKKTIIIIAVIATVVIVAGGGGYFWWKAKNKTSDILKNAADAAEKLTDDATRGTLPSIQTNPLENKPNLNPIDTANPIKVIKINPFK